MKKRPRLSAQQLTDRIARNNHLVNNLADAYANPLTVAGMQGSFLRGLMHSKKHPYLRIMFGLLFFLIPAVTLMWLFITITDFSNPEQVFQAGIYILLAGLGLAVGIKLIFYKSQKL